MLTHAKIWDGIDRLADAFGYSPSGLAKKAGLDPTSFNRSKRHSPDGKPRWPSTESVAKILSVTGATMHEFIGLAGDPLPESGDSAGATTLPLIDSERLARGGAFDAGGKPEGKGWTALRFPGGALSNGRCFAMTVSGKIMEPLCRAGGTAILDPGARLKKSDRAIACTLKGRMVAGEVLRSGEDVLQIRKFAPHAATVKIPTQECAWTARILWVSA